MTITPYDQGGNALGHITQSTDEFGKFLETAQGMNLPAGTAWFKIKASSPISGFELFGTNNGKQAAGFGCVNIHPSLLPKYPGTRAIAESFSSGDSELGITIHEIDEGVDTGPIIVQKSFLRGTEDTLETVENKIHELEHQTYPPVIIELLDRIEGKGY